MADPAVTPLKRRCMTCTEWKWIGCYDGPRDRKCSACKAMACRPLDDYTRFLREEGLPADAVRSSRFLDDDYP